MVDVASGPARLENVPLHLIKPSEVALRGVDRRSEQYLAVADSVAKYGVYKPVLLREIKDPNGGPSVYGLIDGLQRFTASCDAGLQTIPANIKDIDEANLMEAQIITNLIKVDTKPAQYSDQLKRLLSANPLLTMSELADKLSQSTAWLNDRLSLTKLTPEIQKMVDNDEIKLANAFALAKLPVEDQVNYLDRAQTDPTGQFTALVASRVKDLKEAKAQGREAKPQEFVAIPRARTLNDLKSELQAGVACSRVLSEMDVKTPEAAFQAALTWAISMDPASVEEQKVKYEQKKKEREEASARLKKEREEKKQRDAAEKQASLLNL